MNIYSLMFTFNDSFLCENAVVHSIGLCANEINFGYHFEVRWEWRRLHSEELCDLYCSPNIIRVIKSRKWDGWSM